MRIFFYPPMKPLGHKAPSGDLVIATEIAEYLRTRGHDVHAVNGSRARWIYLRPWLWPAMAVDAVRAVREVDDLKPDVWLTYHSYYKAPDLLGPLVRRRRGVPYVMVEASYATKWKRRLKTLPGFYLNRRALRTADYILCNRRDDLVNLGRLLPAERLSYLRPGIHPEAFQFSEQARREIRDELGLGGRAVVMSAAMFRPGVKTEGLAWVIRACGELRRQGLDLMVIIAGEGREKVMLERLAKTEMEDGVRFLGKVARSELCRYYSAADVFAFPGFKESLGMVYLEAQSCGLPVVAVADGGVPEVVVNGLTGLLAQGKDFLEFTDILRRLVRDESLRRRMGAAARDYVRIEHDLTANYSRLEERLKSLARPFGRQGRP